MDPSSNFSNYRTALRGATQRSETAHSSQEKVGEGGRGAVTSPFKSQREPDPVSTPLQIVIPFFSLLIKDIYFLNEGCATRLTNGHINFEVCPGVEVGFFKNGSSSVVPAAPLSSLNGVMSPPGGSEMLCTALTFPLLLQKLWELAKQVSEFLVWRQVICPFERDRRILQYLVTTPVFTEDGQSASLSLFWIRVQISV